MTSAHRLPLQAFYLHRLCHRFISTTTQSTHLSTTTPHVLLVLITSFSGASINSIDRLDTKPKPFTMPVRRSARLRSVQSPEVPSLDALTW